MAITSVSQEYESTERYHDYWIGTRITYKGWGLPMDIGKSNNNFKDRKPKWFNWKVYRHMARNCKKPKKEKDTCKCYKCRKIEHITRDCRTKMKKWSVQEDKNADIEEEDKQKGFREDLK